MTTPAARLAALSDAVMDDMAPEELAVLAEEALEYDGAKAGDIEHMPTGDTPFAMSIQEMTNATYPVVYDRFTGEPSFVNRSMLRAQLEKRDQRGRRVFTTVRPTDAEGNPIIPNRGKEVCVLHVDAENRAEYDAMGLPTCSKANLVNKFQVDNHLRSKHKQEAEAIKAVEDAAIAEEERLVRQALIRANMPPASVQAAPEAPVAASEELEDEIEVAAPNMPIEELGFIEPEVVEVSPSLFLCDECDYAPPLHYKRGKKAGKPMSEKQLVNAVRLHKKSNH